MSLRQFALATFAALGVLAGVACKSSSAPPKQPLVHRFEHADEWTRVFDDPTRDEWQKPDELVKLMQIAPGSTAVDLGTGTGYLLPHLSTAVGPSGTVLALDVEPDMIRYVRERAVREHLANVKAKLVRTDDPLLDAGSVQTIVIVDTWHHVPDRPLYAGRLRDALASKGAVFVVDFTLESAKGPPKNHRLPPEVVRAELAAVGLDALIVVDDPLPEQYVVVGRKP
jgi:cyclopropane fatty-acyl-phospholipid synthase-like methyltransferase